jgi:DNA-binding HxlR family transcriptional regulator
MKKRTNVVRLASDGGDDALPAGVITTLEAIGGKWKIPVLWLLWRRTRRFGELRRALPSVTQHMLTSSLRELEASGLVARTVYAEVPPRVEYSLTGDSLALCDVFSAMQAWGERAASAQVAGGTTAPG